MYLNFLVVKFAFHFTDCSWNVFGVLQQFQRKMFTFPLIWYYFFFKKCKLQNRLQQNLNFKRSHSVYSVTLFQFSFYYSSHLSKFIWHLINRLLYDSRQCIQNGCVTTTSWSTAIALTWIHCSFFDASSFWPSDFLGRCPYSNRSRNHWNWNSTTN